MSLIKPINLAKKLVSVVQHAGRVEMDVYARDFAITTKQDNSPVTEADQAAEAIILEALKQIAPEIPVIAEEAASAGHIPEISTTFFLVDPLDGTKEFIKKSNEFTVNIALINNGAPVFGMVYAPAIKELYLTIDNQNAAMAHLDPFGANAILDDLQLQPISTRSTPANGPSFVASKSHMTEETREFIQQFDANDQKSAGSSLKFCLLAKGEADIYPRFGPTMEWDTAAGHAVLKAAGGVVLNEDGTEFKYGKSDQKYLNPHFIAWGDVKTAHAYYQHLTG